MIKFDTKPYRYIGFSYAKQFKVQNMLPSS